MRGNGWQVHLIIFTCARNAREVRARRKNEEGRKKKRKKEKEWELQVRKINGGKKRKGEGNPQKAERLKRKRRILFTIKKQEDARKGKKGQKTDALSRRRIQRTTFTSRQKIQELHTKKLVGLRKLIYHHVHAI